MRIIYEQSIAFKSTLLKRNNNVLNKKLNYLTRLSKSILLEAAVYHYKPNRKSKVECAKTINKKIKEIYKIEKDLSKYIFD